MVGSMCDMCLVAVESTWHVFMQYVFVLEYWNVGGFHDQLKIFALEVESSSKFIG